MSDTSYGEPHSPPAKPGPSYESLPEVTPPSGSFILQLFLIPMIIVTIIVMLWLGFSWLAHLGTNPQDLVTDVEKLNDGSWQAALTLADVLRNPRYAHLKTDEAFSQRLADVLERQLAEGDLDENRVNLRLYLARVLGELRTPVVLPALAEAATVERDAEVERSTDPRRWFPKEIDVRRGAVESLSVLAGEESLGPDVLRNDPQVMQAILVGSREPTRTPDPNEDAPKLRQTAAYALGVIGGEEALERLASMTSSDPFANARYNAAVGLARNGDARAVAGLVEMLDPENQDAVASEPSPAERDWKRGLIMMNALRAAGQLAEKNPAADLTPVRKAAQKLLAPKYEKSINLEVREAAKEMTAGA